MRNLQRVQGVFCFRVHPCSAASGIGLDRDLKLFFVPEMRAIGQFSELFLSGEVFAIVRTDYRTRYPKNKKVSLKSVLAFRRNCRLMNTRHFDCFPTCNPATSHQAIKLFQFSFSFSVFLRISGLEPFKRSETLPNVHCSIQQEMVLAIDLSPESFLFAKNKWWNTRAAVKLRFAF